jgi:hypothetical protein
MADKTFAECYCEQHALALTEFVRVVRARCLYPHARLCEHFIRLLRPNYFAADTDLIAAAGALSHLRDLPAEFSEYHSHPANSGWGHRLLHLRVSSRKLRRLMRATLHPELRNASRTRLTRHAA